MPKAEKELASEGRSHAGSSTTVAGKVSVSEGSNHVGSSTMVAGKLSCTVASSDSNGTTLNSTGKRSDDANASPVEPCVCIHMHALCQRALQG